MSDKEFDEVVVQDKVLDLAKSEMKKNISRKKRFFTKKGIYINFFILTACTILLIVPILLNTISSPTDDITHIYGSPTLMKNISYHDLKAISNISIQNMNKKNEAMYHWWEEGVRQETTYYLDKSNSLILIEESYVKDDIAVQLYISDYGTNIYDLDIFNFEYDSMDCDSESKKIFTFIDEKNTYYRFSEMYKYYIQINSTDSTITTLILESILNN